MLIFILIVVALVVAIGAINVNKEKVDDEQDFRMYKDPEYRAFNEEKRATEKAEIDKNKSQANAQVRATLIIIAVVGIVVFVWLMGQR